jgi:hypothetical protein
MADNKVTVTVSDEVAAAQQRVHNRINNERDTSVRLRGEEGFGDAPVRTIVDNTFEQGDSFQITGAEEVFGNVINAGKDTEVVTPFIHVLVTNSKNPGKRMVRRFFPSKLFQTVFGYKPITVTENDEEKIVGYAFDKRYETEGSAAEAMKSKATIKEGMELLKGKTLKVTASTDVTTRIYRSREEREALAKSNPEYINNPSEYHVVKVLKFDIA